MTYSVVLEREKGKQYRATVLGWPSCTAAAATREMALEQLRRILVRRLSEVEIVALEIEGPDAAHPWSRFAGPGLAIEDWSPE